ncbi:hypothetical protein [Eleftheria terrae]|uniref:hypothetical protein n=1 Tax=Eleftheria terrae TaxID=1597781 RepID=UPI00263B0782|nr:hypothetical protein [Eleftheria terrae]WKB50551.1 hypothetical protein N7L95_00085 [Eleftheria terrae]
MLRALIDGEKRPPRHSKEKAVCPDCGQRLLAVMPIQHAAHWRHKGRDCDPWSEPEGEWHLAWKERFPEACREVRLEDEFSGEWHRADVRCLRPGRRAAVLELQHSPIVDAERRARDTFYGREHSMYWLLHIHDEGSFRVTNLRMSLNWTDPVDCRGRTFYRMTWMGRSTEFIERWKHSAVHVFFDAGDGVYHLATAALCADLVASLEKGRFALRRVSEAQLIAAVSGVTS